MSNIQILVIDDEPDILHLLNITLTRMGLTVFTAATVGEAKKELDKITFNFCLTDMKLPDGTGIELVEYVHKHYPHTPIAVLTAYGTISHAVDALKKGAFDFITKPISLNILRNLVANAIKVSSGPSIVKTKDNQTQLIGVSKYIHELNSKISKLGRSQSAVIIKGPSGTAKKAIAKCIHYSSHRNSKDFISFDCTPEKQDSSELLEGDNSLLIKANNSTLFLENLEQLDMDTQNKLLHIVETKKLIDSNDNLIDLDIRYICSSTDDFLEQKAANGEFCKSLYNRLHVIDITTIPLSEHTEDIPVWIKSVLTEYSDKWDQLPCKVDSEALHALVDYNYAGNILELRNILERAANLCENNIIRKADLGIDGESKQQILSQRNNRNLEEYIEEIEIQEIKRALKLTKNNKTAAAKILGISFRALRYRINKLGID